MKATLTGPTIIDTFDDAKTYPAGTQFEIDVLDEDADYGFHHTILFTDKAELMAFANEHITPGRYITGAQSFVPLAAFMAERQVA